MILPANLKPGLHHQQHRSLRVQPRRPGTFVSRAREHYFLLHPLDPQRCRAPAERRRRLQRQLRGPVSPPVIYRGHATAHVRGELCVRLFRELYDTGSGPDCYRAVSQIKYVHGRRPRSKGEETQAGSAVP